jgi:hypothetical protein
MYGRHSVRAVGGETMTYRDSGARGPANTASGEAQTCFDCGPNRVRGFGSASRQPRGTAA